MSNCWQDDPELFLHKGHRKCDVLHLWRCKKMRASSSMPLQIGDFIDEGPVSNHLSLVERCSRWKKEQFDALVNYITPRHFLVNCQGFVLVELYKFGDDEKIDDNQRFYLRSLDIINMASYGLDKHTVVVRTPEYLDDDCSCVVAPVANANNQDLQKKVADLEGQNQILKEKEKKLTEDLEKEKSVKQALEKQVADLEAKNKTLTERETKLKEEKSDLEKRVANLEEKVKLLLERIKPADEPAKYVPEEEWMNCYEVCDNWVTADQLDKNKFERGTTSSPVTITKEGVDFEEDDTTNVAAKFFYQTMNGNEKYTLKIVFLEELGSNPEKARFDPDYWGWLNNAGEMHLAGFINE